MIPREKSDPSLGPLTQREVFRGGVQTRKKWDLKKYVLRHQETCLTLVFFTSTPKSNRDILHGLKSGANPALSRNGKGFQGRWSLQPKPDRSG